MANENKSFSDLVQGKVGSCVGIAICLGCLVIAIIVGIGMGAY